MHTYTIIGKLFQENQACAAVGLVKKSNKTKKSISLVNHCCALTMELETTINQ